jgi:predicted  nucleic acid-binding Zn-ribbon protein
LKGNHNRKFSELKSAHSTEFEQLKQQHSTLLEKMTKDLDDVHTTYKSRASEKEIEHTKAVDHVTAELAAITATYQTTVDDLANVKDSLAAAEESIKELTVKKKDLELKLVAGTDSAREAIVASDAEVAKLKKALADSREKVAALEKKDALYTEQHLKEASEREDELLIATTEIASLREKLAVNSSFPNNTDCRTSTPKKTNNLQPGRQNYFKISNLR